MGGLTVGCGTDRSGERLVRESSLPWLNNHFNTYLPNFWRFGSVTKLHLVSH